MKSIARKLVLITTLNVLAQIIGFSTPTLCPLLEQQTDCFEESMETCTPNLNNTNNHNSYFTAAGGWHTMLHIRTMGDVDGDGRADIVGFGSSGVTVSFAQANGNFSYPKTVLKNFALQNGSWKVGQHPRMVADVNGDGKADIVGFGDKGVYVAFSRGTFFSKPTLVLRDFGTASNWKGNTYRRVMADVNGDGKADIVGFSYYSVKVALSTGRTFEVQNTSLKDFCIANGWDANKHIRTMGDVNGDGKADIVGFGNSGVRIALSTGNGFAKGKTVLNKKFAIKGGNWSVYDHPRAVADVNGDGKADIIGFGSLGVQVALSTGNGFAGERKMISKFGTQAGKWSGLLNPRMVADVNGDGKADIVGFGNARVVVSHSNGTGLQKTRNIVFDKHTKVITNISPSDVTTTTKGQTMDYNFSQKELMDMIGGIGKVGGLSMNFVPKTAYIDSEGFLYTYLSMKGSTIDMTAYTNHARTKGYYLKDVQVRLEAEGMSEFRNSPLNKSEEGVYTSSDQFELGAGVTEDGVGAIAQQTWGSTFSTKVTDFQFTNKTKQTNRPVFYWNLAKVGNAAKGDAPSTYVNYRSLGEKIAGQYKSLKQLPPLAAENFPIDCEAIFRKDMRKNKRNIPDQVKVRVYVKATFEKTRLVDRDESDVEDFLNGFVAVFNPRTYEGELAYAFHHEQQVTENYVDVILDLRPLKQ